MKRETALVVPPKGGKMIYKQSRFEQMPTVPFRILCAGRTASGKTSALHSAVTNHYRGCFQRLVIVARTAKLDHSFIELREYAEKHMKQDDRQKQFVFTEFEEGPLMAIFNEHAQQVVREKAQRKSDRSTLGAGERPCGSRGRVPGAPATRGRHGSRP